MQIQTPKEINLREKEQDNSENLNTALSEIVRELKSFSRKVSADISNISNRIEEIEQRLEDGGL